MIEFVSGTETVQFDDAEITLDLVTAAEEEHCATATVAKVGLYSETRRLLMVTVRALRSDSIERAQTLTGGIWTVTLPDIGAVDVVADSVSIQDPVAADGGRVYGARAQIRMLLI